MNKLKLLISKLINMLKKIRRTLISFLICHTEIGIKVHIHTMNRRKDSNLKRDLKKKEVWQRREL